MHVGAGSIRLATGKLGLDSRAHDIEPEFFAAGFEFLENGCLSASAQTHQIENLARVSLNP